jgi:hypothetical protein
MNRAYSLASWNRLKTLGITHKRWITTDPCPVCRANGAQGPVLIHFPSNPETSIRRRTSTAGAR